MIITILSYYKWSLCLVALKESLNRVLSISMILTRNEQEYRNRNKMFVRVDKNK